MQSLPLFENSYSVTEQEVQEWLDNVPNLSKSTFRREAYRRAWNVDGKIRAFKRDGDYEEKRRLQLLP